MIPIRFSMMALLLTLLLPARAQEWKPAPGPLRTRWAEQVSATNAHPEYPRPQMVRDRWLNLNGLWEYALTEKSAAAMPAAEGKILVPFPLESSLSGVGRRIREDQRLWYKRTFMIPEKWAGQRVLLHFGAVDWESTVFVNGKNLGSHRGGYDGFSFDITSALTGSGPQEIVVAVWDPADAGPQPRGKQVRKPEGIWYTPTSGIWQTVWLEPVPKIYIRSLHVVPDIDREQAQITAEIEGPGGFLTMVRVAGRVVNTTPVSSTEVARNRTVIVSTFQVPRPNLWSPESPFLYDMHLSLIDASRKELDVVRSYFGMRKISLGKDSQGRTRLCLNNKPYFQMGPLDQGFWPDGLYTAPTDEALKYDIEVTKRLGFNMARKHVKVEPERWYYWCDRLGLLVWQDMPSGDRYIGGRDPDITRTAESEKIYRDELKAMIDGRRNHPCIVMWVPFNEGWGQFKTAEIVHWIQGYDPSRLCDNTSGWADRGVGDVFDWHVYPGPGSPRPEPTRAAVLGEYGGLGLPLEGHTWQSRNNWGYRSFTSQEALTEAFLDLQRNLHPLIGDPGCSAAVYTQTTDVEVEVNGLMSYDRAIIKMDPARVRAANVALLGPPPVLRTMVATSETEGHGWRYTTSMPGSDWMKAGYEDSTWPSGQAGFGTRDTPGTHVRTEWRTPDIWIRRTFSLSSVPANPLFLRIHHDEDADVYLNGVLAARVRGYTSSYTLAAINAQAAAALHSGENTIAIHCHQTGGGQYIDAGIQEMLPPR